VTYGLAFTDDARATLRALDPWLQEEALDEIDRVAAAPQNLRPRRGASVVVHDFIRQGGGLWHYVFVELRADDASQTVEVVKVGHYARP